MPGRNGTGPMGMGPMTGRGYGFCGNGYYGRRNCYGIGLRRRGLGFGAGLGLGLGAVYGVKRAFSQKELLQNQKEFLESQIELIDRELDDLDD